MTEKKINGKTIRVMKGNVTDLEVDAFVYYATEDLKLGSGYGTAISVRGGPSIQEELEKLAPLNVGEAVVSGAGEMKAGHIIHSVGPKFQEPDEEMKLRKTMISTLNLATEKDFKRLAFPPMGTGFYGVPVEVCARVMIETIREQLTDGPSSVEEIIICVPDNRELAPFAKALEAA